MTDKGESEGTKYTLLSAFKYIWYYLTMANPAEKFYKLRDAIRHALIHYENSNGKKGKQVKRGDALRQLAVSLIEMAINGNDSTRLAAIKELADRLDGRPVQAIAGIEGEPITVVQRVIVQQAVDDDSIPIVREIDARKLIN